MTSYIAVYTMIQYIPDSLCSQLWGLTEVKPHKDWFKNEVRLGGALTEQCLSFGAWSFISISFLLVSMEHS